MPPKTILQAVLGALKPEKPSSKRDPSPEASMTEDERTTDADLQPVTIGRNQGQWVSLDTLTDVKVLYDAGGSTSLLLRLLPGAQLPAHVHPADEECLCLEGELRLGEGVILRAGDYHLAPKGVAHAVAHTHSGALLFLRSAEPVYRP